MCAGLRRFNETVRSRPLMQRTLAPPFTPYYLVQAIILWLQGGTHCVMTHKNMSAGWQGWVYVGTYVSLLESVLGWHAGAAYSHAVWKHMLLGQQVLCIELGRETHQEVEELYHTLAQQLSSVSPP